jgi:hypothetical protein
MALSKQALALLRHQVYPDHQSPMRTEAQQLINEIVEDIYSKLDRIESEIVADQQEDPHVVPALISVQQSLRETLRLAEGCLVNTEERPS